MMNKCAYEHFIHFKLNSDKNTNIFGTTRYFQMDFRFFLNSAM